MSTDGDDQRCLASGQAVLCDELLADRLLTILRGFDLDGASIIVDGILSAGLRFVEVTVERGSFDLLKRLRQVFGNQIRLGAGTIVTDHDARVALKTGAEYLVSPGWFPDVAAVASSAGVLYIPGVATPTEVGLALRAGFGLQKLYPAGLLGPDYLRALMGPYPALKVFAVGNMSFELMGPMMAAGAAGIALGAAVFGRGDQSLSRSQVEEVAKRAREVVQYAATGSR